MKRKIYVVALVLAVLLGNRAAWADGEFYVIAGGGAVGTKITSLPYSINTPGFYFLGGNLTSSGNGITITASNVTLDLMGFTLAGGNTGSGIGLSGGPDNVEIRNGTIRNFYIGVNGQITHSIASNNSRMVNVRVNHCGTYGAKFDGKSHLVKDCTFTNNGGAGLTMSAGTISGCVACDNSSSGISLAGPGSVTGNIANNNNNYNFYLGTIDMKTPILVNGNSADGLPRNYFITPGTGVFMGTNAGTP